MLTIFFFLSCTLDVSAQNYESFVGELKCSSGPTMGPFTKQINGNFHNNISNFYKTTYNDNIPNQNNEFYQLKINENSIILEAEYKFQDRTNNIFLKGNINVKDLNDNTIKGVMTGSKNGGAILRECEAKLKIKTKNLDIVSEKTLNISSENKSDIKFPYKNTINKTNIKFYGFIHCDATKDKLYPEFTVNFDSQFNEGVALWQKNVKVARDGGLINTANYKLTIYDNKETILESDILISSGNKILFKLKGIVNNENKIELRGNEYYPSNIISRQCDASIILNGSPYPVSPKNNAIEVKNNIKNVEEKDNTFKIAEIQKNQLKEDAEAKAKAAEANRLAAIEAEKQKQRDAAEAKARADKAVKEAEIERLAALEIEKKRLRDEAEAKAKAAEANRLAAIEAEKQKQRDAAEAKARADKAAKEADIKRLAALEIEKQTQKEAVAARVAQMEAEKIRQKELAEAREQIEKDKEVVRLAALEIEKKKAREQLEEKVKSDALRVATLEAENQKQKEEAEARAKAQRLLELENEMKRLMGETTPPKPPVLSRQDPVKNDNDPLSAFEGTWVSVNPPVFYLIFTKVSLGIRQVSLPNLGQGNIRLSDGLHGSNFQISAPNLNCFYFVSFTNNRQKMVMELKAGDNLCLQSSVLEKSE